MSMELLYYKPRAMIGAASPLRKGSMMLSYFFRLYNAGSIPVDRTGTLTTPVRMRSLFPIPKFQAYRGTYEEVCNERAREILTRSEKLNSDICILWSGGIDSTLAIVSLLKNATPQQKKRLIVIMSKDSILENPNFFHDHIRGKLRTETRSALAGILGNKMILTSGEHNDQLFGSDMTFPLIMKHGNDFIHAPYNRAQIHAHYTEAMGHAEVATNYIDLFEQLANVAPIPIRSNFEFLWWINFSLKWQTVFTRILTFVAPFNAHKITAAYVHDYYMPFFNTEHFQLWSLNNLDKRIRDEWRTYKWPAKELIYGFTKDADYRDNKIKVGSLSSFMRVHDTYQFLDTDFKLHRTLDPETFFEPKNDFTDPILNRTK